MHCPFCQATDTKVVDSRLVAEGSQVRRRRECPECKERFTSFESVELAMPVVVKRDGRREPFSIQNLKAGMLRALEKRPVSVDSLEAAVASITQKIKRCGEREIEAKYIGEWVMEALYRLDHVAYVRFASVYKRFKDVSEFKQAIDAMSDHSSAVDE